MVGKVIWLIDMMDVNEAVLAQQNRLAYNEVLDHELQSFSLSMVFDLTRIWYVMSNAVL